MPSSVKPMVTWGTSPDQAIGFDEKIPAPESFSDPGCQGGCPNALFTIRISKAGDFIRKTPIPACLHWLVYQFSLMRLRSCCPGAQRPSCGPRRSRTSRFLAPCSFVAKLKNWDLTKIFKDAGFEWRKSGCSLCLAMNDDILEAGVRCASTTNRNFEGRQGRGSHTHLVSPETAAASAVMGYLCPKSELE